MSGWLSMADGRRVPLRDGFVLGRTAGCDLVVDDSKASRRHARIHVQSGVIEIEDLQSSNGTLLNDKPVARRMLRDGDRIRIGQTVLVFHEGDLPGAPPTTGTTGSGFDDNDLFGDGLEPAPTTVAAPPPSASAPPSAPAPPVAAVVEFADEVVEVRQPSARPQAPAARPAAGPTLQASSRVLQFSRHAQGGGMLADDLKQMSGGRRAFLVLCVLVAGAALAALIVRLVR